MHPAFPICRKGRGANNCREIDGLDSYFGCQACSLKVLPAALFRHFGKISVIINPFAEVNPL